jgi:predicted peptidase
MATPAPTGQYAYTFEKETAMGQEVRLNYLLFLPQDYQKEPQKKWPLILFLPGLGERGDSIEELELLKVHGPPMVVEKQPDFPFIVLSPQCPSDSYWVYQLDNLNALLDEIVATYAVDPDRLYLTGLSMGGDGAWALAIRYPARFAAVVPIAARGNKYEVCSLKETPIWAFHGANDTVVPPSESEEMVKALEECGVNVRFTLYPDAEHDSWTETYNNPELYTWLLQQSR